MRVLLIALVLLFAASFSLSGHMPPSQAVSGAAAPVRTLDAARLPWMANEGQLPREVVFTVPLQAGHVFVTHSGEIVHALARPDEDGVALREHFVGGALERAFGCERADVLVNSYVGDDEALWRTGIAAYDRVRLERVYDGIDVDLVARRDGVEKLFCVAAGADPASIRVRVDGAESLKTNAGGTLTVATEAGTVVLSRPVAYQECDGRREFVDAAYDVVGDTYGFTVSGHDPERDLVIDPLLEATFLGGSGNNPETGRSVVVDAAGSVFVAGETPSADFPVTFGTYRGGGSDAFVCKLSQDLSTLEAATFLGGGGRDLATALALWQDDYLFVGGETDSGGLTATPKFPTTTGAFQEDVALIPGISSIPADCFVAKLATDTLALDAATYFGGRRPETLYGIDLDADGDVFLTGQTSANETTGVSGQFFPILGSGYDHTYNGQSSDAFVAKLSNDLTTGIASTYLGGSSTETARVVKVDADGEVLVGGTTNSTDFPATATLGTTGGFLSRLSNDLSTLEDSAFTDQVRGLVVGEDSVIVCLRADDGGFPATAGAFDETYNGGADVVIARIDEDLSAIIAATYLGGSANDFVGSFRAGLAVDGGDGILVGGWTASTNFPTTPAAYSTTFIGGTPGGEAEYDAFVARLSHDLSALDYSTYLGGTGNDDLQDLAIDDEDNVVVVGSTVSADFPVSLTAYQDTPAFPPSSDAYVARVMTRDGDDDGVVDAEEMGPTGDDPLFDGNNDGQPDHEQANVCSFFTFSGADYVTIACPPTSELLDVEAVETPAAGAPAAWRFRYDLVRYCVTVPNPGDTVEVTLFLPASPGSYWKYGPTAANPTDHWYRFDPAGALITGNTVTLTLTDGGQGDGDLVADAKATDPGGPGFEAPEQGGGGDTCLMVAALKGSWMEGHLGTLRGFRDRWLLPHAAGQVVAAVYYRYSPPIAAYLEAHVFARVLVRFALVPLVYGIRFWWAVTALLFLVLLQMRRRRAARVGVACAA